MPAGDIDRMPAERRMRLVRTAAREFAAEGYEHASLNRIIRECGLSKSSFYHVIASKNELFDLVVRDLISATLENIRIPNPEKFETRNFWDQVDGLIDTLAEASAKDEAFAALGGIFYLSDTGSGTPASVSEALTSIGRWLQDVLLAGRRQGQVRDDLPIELQSRLVFAILRTLDQWVAGTASTMSIRESAAYVRTAAETVRRILDPGCR